MNGIDRIGHLGGKGVAQGTDVRSVGAGMSKCTELGIEHCVGKGDGDGERVPVTCGGQGCAGQVVGGQPTSEGLSCLRGRVYI